jgi:hypothetical protein
MRSRTVGSVALGVVACVAWSVVALDGSHATRRARRASDTPAHSDAAAGGVVASRGSAVISGRVTAAGGAVSGAEVCASCADCYADPTPRQPNCASTDSLGRYELRALASGAYRLLASARGYEPAPLQDATALRLAGRDLVDQDIELRAGGSRITGVVLDATGGPIAHAAIVARSSRDGLPAGRKLEQLATSDDAGAFALDVSAGELDIVATADGYAPYAATRYAPVQNLKIVLAPAARVSGVVVSVEDGGPVPGVRVTALGDEAGDIAASDAEGRFVISRLLPGHYRLEALGAGWIGRYDGRVAVGLGGEGEDVVVPVMRGARVAGAIRVGDGPCIAGTAYLMPEAGARLPMATASTDLDGRVTFEAVPAGRYRSSASCLDYGDAVGEPVDVADQDIEGLSWQVDAGAELLVHVRSPRGEPIPRAWIRVGAALNDTAQSALFQVKSGRSDDTGDVRFVGVAPGAQTVHSPGTVVASLPVQVVAGERNEVTFVLDDRGAIEVVVRDRHGKPNDEVAVAAQGDAAAGGLAEPRGDGRYYIGALEAGSYRVIVGDSTNPLLDASGAAGVVHVRAGETAKLEAAYGGHTGRITGRVVDARGKPVANTWVSVQPSAENLDSLDVATFGSSNVRRQRRLTDADGRFELDGLFETGSYTVVASHVVAGRAQNDRVHVGQHVQLSLAVPRPAAPQELSSITDPSTQTNEETQ